MPVEALLLQSLAASHSTVSLHMIQCSLHYYYMVWIRLEFMFNAHPPLRSHWTTMIRPPKICLKLCFFERNTQS